MVHTVNMVLGGHRDLTGFVTGGALVASLGANISAFYESKYAVSTTGFAQYLHILFHLKAFNLCSEISDFFKLWRKLTIAPKSLP